MPKIKPEVANKITDHLVTMMAEMAVLQLIDAGAMSGDTSVRRVSAYKAVNRLKQEVADLLKQPLEVP